MSKYFYDVVFRGDMGAGLLPYSDSIVIEASGEYDAEFAEFMRAALSDWYDGARVKEFAVIPVGLSS